MAIDMNIDPNKEITPALRDFADYAASNWERLHWGLYGSSRTEDAMGLILRRMRDNGKPFAEITQPESRTNMIEYLIDEGYLDIDRRHSGKILVALTEKAIVGILQNAVTQFSIPDSVAHTYGVSLSGTSGTALPAAPRPPRPL